MAKTTKQNPTFSSIRIRRAAKASRKMSIQERAQIMVKAGLVSQDQADQAKRKLKVTEVAD
jgi:hypothetical protein